MIDNATIEAYNSDSKHRIMRMAQADVSRRAEAPQDSRLRVAQSAAGRRAGSLDISS
jgi:hypothetical protein